MRNFQELCDEIEMTPRVLNRQWRCAVIIERNHTKKAFSFVTVDFFYLMSYVKVEAIASLKIFTNNINNVMA